MGEIQKIACVSYITEGRTDGQTDGRTNDRTNRRTDILFFLVGPNTKPLVPRGNNKIFENMLNFVSKNVLNFQLTMTYSKYIDPIDKY